MAHVIVLIARLTLGGIWIIAAMAKLATPEVRSQAVEEFGILNGRPAQALGSVLPYVELTLGFLLLTGEKIRVAAVCSAFLLTAFSTAMMLTLLQGRTVRCNCFGQLGDGYVSWASLVRNAVLLALAVVPAVLPSNYMALPRLFAGGAPINGEPAFAELLPALLSWLGLLLGLALVAAMWGALTAMAHAAAGPADELPETQWIRRLSGVDTVQPPPAPTNGD